jgi:sugar lactone lactonase YvrE
MRSGLEVLVAGLVFPECPRWHDDRLWLSDMHAHVVLGADLNGRTETIAELPDKPGGLGFLPDGAAAVVAMRSRQIYRIDKAGTLDEHADLTSVSAGQANDMVVDALGRAYVGQTALRTPIRDHARHPQDQVVLVDVDGTVRVVADGLNAPNGMVITPDARTLIVAETWGDRLTAFDIAADGSLGRRRMFARLESSPDGICLDEQGAIWVSYPLAGKFQRVLQGGAVTAELAAPDGHSGMACCLGGPNRRTLFLAVTSYNAAEVHTLHDFAADKTSTAKGWIYVTEVPVAGAGWP